MPAYDNAQLQAPPQAPSYAAPLIGPALGQMLGSLPQDYVQAQQAARTRQLQANVPARHAGCRLQRCNAPVSIPIVCMDSWPQPVVPKPCCRSLSACSKARVYNQIMGGGGGEATFTAPSSARSPATATTSAIAQPVPSVPRKSCPRRSINMRKTARTSAIRRPTAPLVNASLTTTAALLERRSGADCDGLLFRPGKRRPCRQPDAVGARHPAQGRAIGLAVRQPGDRPHAGRPAATTTRRPRPDGPAQDVAGIRRSAGVRR